MAILGWDIGGVNTKVARVDAGRIVASAVRPYELQRAPDSLVATLRDLAGAMRAPADTINAVTMTAELSQMFRTKRDGVRFIVDAVEAAFPDATIHVYATDGRWRSPTEARREPLAVAAANWAATARIVAAHHPDALLIDIGTTTTDIIPIAGGEVAARGWTDPDRLASGELVYTGAVRTPAEAIAHTVTVGGVALAVSAEGFALAGDVHVWRGALAPADYTTPTPDGRPVAREFAGERIARVVCADRDMLDEAAIDEIAGALAAAQVASIAGAIVRVRARHPHLRRVVVTGLGAFIGTEAARRAGMEVVPLSDHVGDDAARCAPAAAVALLLDAWRADRRVVAIDRAAMDRAAGDSRACDAVIKVGGGLLTQAESLDRALAAIASAAAELRLAIVPGGGPFADAVRDVDRRLGLADAAAHWMAVLAMDQYAQLLASKLSGSAVVFDAAGIHQEIAAGRIPILAPSRWLMRRDPLPHSWRVTSDSIAAWVAGQVGAPQLLLIKPPEATGGTLVDEAFADALPPGVEATVVSADYVNAGLRQLCDRKSAQSNRSALTRSAATRP